MFEVDTVDTSNMTSILIIEKIDEDFEENGVIEPDTCSKLLAEYIEAAEYLNEKPDTLELHPRRALYKQYITIEREDTVLKNMHEAHPEYSGIEVLPPCYTFCNDEDPGCAVCPVRTDCKKDRVHVMENMPCFGIAFQASNAKCMGCYENTFCKTKMMSKGGLQ